MNNKKYFFSPLKSVFILAAVFAVTSILMSYSPQPPIGKTGAPGESNCASCHTTPSANYDGLISLSGLPTEIIGNQTYTLTLNVVSTDVRPEVGGFQLVVLDSTNTNAGSLELVNFVNTSYQTDSTGRQYVGHKNAMPFGNSDTIAWTFRWTAPPTATSVVFYSAALLADNQGSNDGDTQLFFAEAHTTSAPLSMEVVINSVSNPACHNGSNGVAHAAVLNGTQPYSYIWSTGDTIAWVYNLSAGTHSVTVTDANNQIASQSVTIEQPDEIVPEISASSLIIPCGGSVTLHGSATGGTGPLTLSWNTGASDVDSIVVTSSGYYCLVATDSTQCQANFCVGVNQDQEGIFCNGLSADTITCAQPTTYLHPGVTSIDTISYSWTGPNGFTSTDTLPQITEGGIYTLVASIPTGCSCSSSMEVVALTEFEFQITEITPTTCYDSADGAVDADFLSGQYPPFTTIPANFSNDSLSQGTYSVTVTNAVGCSTVVDFTIPGPDSIWVSLDSIHGSNNVDELGFINITTNGGTTPYQWSWTYNQDSSIISTSEDINSLLSGSYSVGIIDTNGCQYNFGPYEVENLVGLQDVIFAQSLTISPTPASDFITLTQNDYNAIPLSVQIYTLDNRLVGQYHFSEKKNMIDVSHFPKGLYHVIIQKGNQLAVKKIVIQK